MKDEKDYGPADYYAEGQMIGVAIVIVVILAVVVYGWIASAFQ